MYKYLLTLIIIISCFVQSCVMQDEVIESTKLDVIEIPSVRIIASIPKDSSSPTPAIILLSGGGYGYVGARNVLDEWKSIMAKNGIALFSVDYSLPQGNPKLPVNDVLKSYDFIRSHCRDYNIDPDLIGIMGFSAGGHLSSLIATKYSSHIDLAFQVLFYPVISMELGLTHWGPRVNLLGAVSEDVAKEYSPDLLVTNNTPPSYIILSDPDDIVPPENGKRYHQKLLNNRIESNLVVLNAGGHGWQWSNCPDYNSIEELISWIKIIKK